MLPLDSASNFFNDKLYANFLCITFCIFFVFKMFVCNVPKIYNIYRTYCSEIFATTRPCIALVELITNLVIQVINLIKQTYHLRWETFSILLFIYFLDFLCFSLDFSTFEFCNVLISEFDYSNRNNWLFFITQPLE